MRKKNRDSLETRTRNETSIFEISFFFFLKKIFSFSSFPRILTHRVSTRVMETRKLEKGKSANFGQMECRRDFVAKEDNWRFGLARKFLKIERTAWKRTRQVVAGRSFQLTGQTRTFTIPRLLAVESVHTFLHEIISFDFVAILILLSLVFPSFFFFFFIYHVAMDIKNSFR